MVLRNLDSKARLSDFESQLYPCGLCDVGTLLYLSGLHFHQVQKGDDKSTDLIEFLWGLNELVFEMK